MVDPPAHPSGSAHRSSLERLNQICDAFKKECVEGRTSPMEEYLEQVDEVEREALMERLLAVELQLRREKGETPSALEYQERFPQYRALVTRLFDAPETDPRQARETNSLLDTELTIRSPSRQINLTEQFARYRIVRKLGEGAMGAVFLAVDPQLERRVAIKVPFLSERHQTAILDRFREEARAVAAIRHPNICPIFEVGEHQGIPFIAMAYIEGQPLSELLRTKKLLDVDQVLSLVVHIAKALAEVHRQSVIHRDLKPANIIVDRQGDPVIMDFGLARRQKGGDQPLTSAGTAIGTPAYMAPEQLRGEKAFLRPQCDIYSLGVILYEMLTGTRPFSGDILEIVSQILTAPPKPPSAYRHEIDAQLDQICLQAMAREVADRFQSMSEFAEALARYASSTQPGDRLTRHDTVGTVPVAEKANKETLSDVIELKHCMPLEVRSNEIGIRLLDQVDGEEESEWILSSDETITIGRDEGSNVRLDDLRISRCHAVISYDEGQWKYANLGRNGTFVEGERIDDFVVTTGDVVQLSKKGPRLQFFVFSE